MNLFKSLLKHLALFVFIFFVFGLANPLQAQTKNVEEEIKLGLVLSGGGAKGFAHIGVLKVLEEEIGRASCRERV